MDTNLQKYFELVAALKVVNVRQYVRRAEISRELGVDIGKAQDHPDYKALAEESARIYWEADALTPFVIRANLEQFGIGDIEVTGVLMGRDRVGVKLGQAQMLLSDLCGFRYHGLAAKLEVEVKDAGLRVIVEKNGTPIGHIDSDGDFDYEAAPDLRTALGWKIATDGGRARLIEFFNLDQAAASLRDTIRANGFSKDAFFGPYFGILQRVFVYERTTRFGDGHCGAATTLWHVATRELGEEHPGYPFCY